MTDWWAVRWTQRTRPASAEGCWLWPRPLVQMLQLLRHNAPCVYCIFCLLKLVTCEFMMVQATLKSGWWIPQNLPWMVERHHFGEKFPGAQSVAFGSSTKALHLRTSASAFFSLPSTGDWESILLGYPIDFLLWGPSTLQQTAGCLEAIWRIDYDGQIDIFCDLSWYIFFSKRWVSSWPWYAMINQSPQKWVLHTPQRHLPPCGIVPATVEGVMEWR